MKNHIHRPILRMGMPYHGLVTDGELPNPDGPIPVLHTASVEGAIAFQLRTPPPAKTLSAEQIANDTAHGWQWNDYALLCGWYRNVGGADAQLGATSWLYADNNDVVWIMELVPTLRGPTGGFYYYDVEIWRRQPFGRFRFNLPDRTVIDELLGTITIQLQDRYYIDDTTYYTGGVFGLNLRIPASAIVPSLHGDSVHVSMLQILTATLPGTESYWELGLRSVWAQTTITISGDGLLDGDGSGISASYSAPVVYPDMFDTAANIPNVPAIIDPFPINHITTLDTKDCPSVPSGPGTCQESCDAVFTNDGVVFYSTAGQAGFYQGISDVTIYTYHGQTGDQECLQTYNQYEQNGDQQDYLEGQGGGPGSAEMSSEQTLTAATDDGGQTYYWVAGAVTRVCSAWKATEAQSEIHNEVGIDIAGNTDSIDLWKADDQGQRWILGFGTDSDCGCVSWLSDDGFPGAIGDFFNRTYTFSEPYTITDVDTTAYCDIEQSCRMIVFPGMVGYVAAHVIPNGVDRNYTQIRHWGKLWGIGADGTLTLITTWGPIVEADLTIRFPWTSVAWQPWTKQFNVQTDGVTLVKYI